MSGDDDLSDLLGPEPERPAPIEVEVAPEKPKSRPMGEASRALLERSRNVVLIPRKNTPERLKNILRYASEMPVANSICMRAGISTSTLKYWVQKSKEGGPGDGFDIAAEENDEDIPIRFHEAFENATESGLQVIEAAMMQRAIGYREVLTYQGRVIYKRDPRLTNLGLPPEEEYLLDEFGAPVPETVIKQDPDLMQFIMERRMKEKYGRNSQVDLNVRGGVLVVGVTAATSEALNVLEEDYRKNGRPSVVFDEGEEDPN